MIKPGRQYAAGSLIIWAAFDKHTGNREISNIPEQTGIVQVTPIRNDTISASLSKIIYVFHLGVILLLAAAKQNVVSQFFPLILQSCNQFEKELVTQFIHHYTNGIGLLHNQRTGKSAGNIMGLFHDVQDFFPILRADPRLVIQHPGNQCTGYIGLFGNIRYGCHNVYSYEKMCFIIYIYSLNAFMEKSRENCEKKYENT